MSPPSASQKELALDAIAKFFEECGLSALSSSTQSEREKHSRSGPASKEDEAFVARLQGLAVCLTGIATSSKKGAGGSNGSGTGQDWVDTMLFKIANSSARNSLGKELCSKLDRVVSSMIQDGAPAPGSGGWPQPGSEKALAAAPENAADPPAPPPPPPTEPSSSYRPRRMGHPDADTVYDTSLPEEYRDDNDPGYRVREVSEAELVTEIQENYAYVVAAAQAQASVAYPPSPPQQAATSASAPSTAGQTMGAPAVDDDELLQAGGGPSPQQPETAPTVPEAPELSTFAKHAGPPVLAAFGMLPSEGSPEEAATSAAPAAVPTFGGSDTEVQSSTEQLPQVSPDGVPAPSTLAAQAAQAMQAQSTDQATMPLQIDVASTEVAGAPPVDGSLAAVAASQQQGFPPQCGGAAVAAAAAAASAAAAVPSNWPAGQPQPAPNNGYAYIQPQTMAMPHALASKRKEKRRGDRPPCRYADSGDPFYPVELDGIIYDSFSLRIVHERDRTGFEESKEFPIRINSIVAARYQVLEHLGSAAFSRAVQCLDLHSNRMVCMKIIKNDKDFLDQSLDEIKLLKIINANADNVDEKHCLRLIDYFYHKEHLIIVTELLRDNLYEFSKFNRECGEEPYFTLGRLQRITKQVLIALEYIHRLWLIHADLKPENILVKSYSRCEVKVIDFGSSCFIDDHLSSYVQSRSYRAPEVMMGLPCGQKIDIWSLGCIIAELWTGYVLFQNDSIQSLLARIMGIIGPFPPHMLAWGKFVPQHFTQDGRLYRELERDDRGAGGTSVTVVPERRVQLFLPKRSSLRQRMRTSDEEFIDFLTCLLKVDPAQRPTAPEALQHPWLTPGRYPDGLQA